MTANGNQPNEAHAPWLDYALAAEFLDHLRGEFPSGLFQRYSSPARHFLFWLNERRIPVASVDDTVVDRFARHRCRCARYSPRELKASDYTGRVRRFVRFLEDRGDIPVAGDVNHIGTHLAEFAGHLESVGYSLV
ncbi:MAG: hypothetical protein ACLPPF_07055, partial [Rhodomicrobium sp.]